MAVLTPSPKQQFFATDGSPLASGLVYTYAAGTTTPITTYVNSAGVSANTNPIVLNSRGEADIWLVPGTAYKFVLKTAADATIWTVDNIVATDASGVVNWLTGVTGTNTYSVSGVSGFTAYTAGQVFRFSVPNTNTGASTLNINGAGAKAIRRAATTEMAAGDLSSGTVVEMVYNGTNFRVIGLPGSLTVDASGQVSAPSFQSSSTFDGPGARFNNYVINGGMTIDQRNGGASLSINSATTPGNALVYTVDRFYASAVASAGTPAFTVEQIEGVTGFRNYARLTGAAAITAISFGTRLEAVDTYELADTSVTIALAVRSSTLTTLGWALYYAASTDAFGTIAAPTRTLISSGTFSGITVDFGVVSATVSVPAAATTGLELVFTTGALVAGQTVDYAFVGLYGGSVVPLILYPPYALELARCQRFFCKTFNVNTKPANNTNLPGNIVVYTQAVNTQYGYGWRYPAAMRAAPSTFVFYNPAAADSNWTNSGVTATVLDTGDSGTTLAAVGPTIGAGVRSEIHATAEAEIP